VLLSFPCTVLSGSIVFPSSSEIVEIHLSLLKPLVVLLMNKPNKIASVGCCDVLLLIHALRSQPWPAQSIEASGCINPPRTFNSNFWKLLLI
jgi:hypothetical protein